MIPVENAQIQRIDTKIRKHDNMDTRKKNNEKLRVLKAEEVVLNERFD